jgi:hypothetical protein
MARLEEVSISLRPTGGGMAHCHYRRDGTVLGGHASPGPAPLVHHEDDRVAAKVVDAIWAAAYALDPALVAAGMPLTGGPRGATTITLVFDDRSGSELSWPSGTEHPDASVRALASLLMAHRVGGW